MNEPACAPPEYESDRARDEREWEESDRGDRERKDRRYPVTRERVTELSFLSAGLDIENREDVVRLVLLVNGLCSDLLEEMNSDYGKEALCRKPKGAICG